MTQTMAVGAAALVTPRAGTALTASPSILTRPLINVGRQWQIAVQGHRPLTLTATNGPVVMVVVVVIVMVVVVMVTPILL